MSETIEEMMEYLYEKEDKDLIGDAYKEQSKMIINCENLFEEYEKEAYKLNLKYGKKVNDVIKNYVYDSDVYDNFAYEHKEDLIHSLEGNGFSLQYEEDRKHLYGLPIEELEQLCKENLS